MGRIFSGESCPASVSMQGKQDLAVYFCSSNSIPVSSLMMREIAVTRAGEQEWAFPTLALRNRSVITLPRKAHAVLGVRPGFSSPNAMA